MSTEYSAPCNPLTCPTVVRSKSRSCALTTVGGAKEEFPEETPTMLSDRDRDRFLELLENPPPPNAALRKAIAVHRKQYG